MHSVPLKKSYYGQGTGSILLDNVNCLGSETNLLKCSRGGRNTRLFDNNCDHSEDAGVKCNCMMSLK